MDKTVTAFRGMVVAPHYLASEAGLNILRQGGNAVEAAVATAAVLFVVYPHMTGLGGDAFWTIYDPASQRVTCVDGSGLSGGWRDARLGRECGVDRGRCGLGHRQHDVRPALGPVAHVRRGPRGAGHVVRRARPLIAISEAETPSRRAG